MNLRSPANLAIVAVAVIVVAAAGYWAYGAHRKSQLDSAANAAVQDASNRVREALSGLHAGPQDLAKVDANDKAIEAQLARLHSLGSSANRPLYEAVDEYLTDSRGVMRRVTNIARSRAELSSSVKALSDRMQQAGARSEDWIRETLALKQKMEKDFFDYQLLVGGLEKFLGLFGDNRKKLAPHLSPALMVEASLLAESRKRLLDLSAQATDEVEKARKLATPR